ncbi:hypothetical protein, partial [uncultured Corynebacterium sp.]|uniref:hypothetical protein n=1 Tax=uncultured Corynebacterium sp. TaxID=159447 RepID=UPI0025E2FB62
MAHALASIGAQRWVSRQSRGREHRRAAHRDRSGRRLCASGGNARAPCGRAQAPAQGIIARAAAIEAPRIGGMVRRYGRHA